MSRIRGKKPTWKQYKILEDAGVENPKDYLFNGIVYKGLDEKKSPAKNSLVTATYHFVHKMTGATLDIQNPEM